MNEQSLDTRLILIAVGTFLLTYIFTFPTGWLISDEYSYLNQGIAISNWEKVLAYSDAVTEDLISYQHTSYPLGNAFWIAFWAKVCSLKYAYLGSLFAILLSTFLTYRIIAKESFFKLSLLLLFIYPSLTFFSKSFMSCVPSLLVVSTFLYILFNKKETGKKWFFLAFIASLSFWIRETNIVLLGSICLIHFVQDRRWFLYYASGTIIGFLPRILSSYYYYNDPFYYVLAESFSINNLIVNAQVYGIILLLFMPLGLFFMLRYKGRYSWPLSLSSLLFILMYFMYSFNATIYSGFSKGLILMGRFMIPVLPIFVLSVGWYFRKNEIQENPGWMFNKVTKISATLVISLLIIGMQFLVFKEARLHKKVSNHIYANYQNKMIMFDLSRTTNIIRYINPFHGNLSYISDISNLKEEDFMNTLFKKYDEAYLIQTLNTGNSNKIAYTSKIDKLVQNAVNIYETEEIERIKIKPALFLQVIKIGKMGKMGKVVEIGGDF